MCSARMVFPVRELDLRWDQRFPSALAFSTFSSFFHIPQRTLVKSPGWLR